MEKVKIYSIYLDAGHGKHTEGKCSTDGSVTEWELNDRVCKFVANNLAKYNCVVYRCDDTTGETDPMPTKKRLVAAEEGGADACISVHHNISISNPEEATGVEVFITENYTEGSKKLAEEILHNLVANTGMKNRGLKTSNLSMCAPKVFPTVLVEGGFLTNKSDLEYIKSDKGVKAYAKAISSALISVLGLTKDFEGSALGEKKGSAVYYVSTAFENLTNRKGEFNALSSAIAECDKYEGYKVFDENGDVVHESELQPDPSTIKYVKVGSKGDHKMAFGQTLKMRDKPNAKEGSIIKEIPYGTRLILKSKTNSSFWYCATEDGKYFGYLHNAYLIELN